MNRLLLGLSISLLVALGPNRAVAADEHDRPVRMVCAVLREDGVVTDIPSGENAGNSLVARFPARKTKYEFIELDGKSPVKQRFPFDIDPAWNRKHLSFAVFVQDKRTGEVYQAADVPWLATQNPRAASSAAKPARHAP